MLPRGEGVEVSEDWVGHLGEGLEGCKGKGDGGRTYSIRSKKRVEMVEVNGFCPVLHSSSGHLGGGDYTRPRQPGGVSR